MLTETASLILHVIPPAVRAAVEEECKERDVSRDALVGGVLAARYGITFEASPYGWRGPFDPDATWVIRVPRILRERLHDEATQTASAQSRLVVAILAERYGLPIPSTRDRRGVQPRDEAGRFSPKGGR